LANLISLEEFKNNLRQLARPNRFRVVCCPPSIFDEDMGNTITGDSDAFENLIYHIKTGQIPGRNIGEHQMKFGGMTLNLPGDTTFEDLTITVLNPMDWEFRSFFENWQSLILDVRNNGRYYADEILKDAYVDIEQLDNEGEILVTYRYHSAYPKNISQIDLSMDTNDSVEEFTVTFGFSYWERLEG
jgi:hypothetical protein